MAWFHTVRIPARISKLQFQAWSSDDRAFFARALLTRFEAIAPSPKPGGKYNVSVCFTDGESIHVPVDKLQGAAARVNPTARQRDMDALVAPFNDRELHALKLVRAAKCEERMKKHRQPQMSPSRLHRQGQQAHSVEVIDIPGDRDALDKKILDTLASKRADAGRADGGRHGASDGIESGESRSDGVAKGGDEGQVSAGQESLRRFPTRAIGGAETHSKVGATALGGNVTGPLAIALVKQQGGHKVEIAPNMADAGTWSHEHRSDGSYGLTAYMTAPELDRLISQLCQARDKCRAANRPHHGIGNWRV